MGLVLPLQLPSRVRDRLRVSIAARLAGMVLAATSLASATSAQAQSFTWGGAGSSTTTTDYNLGTNWATPPAGAPPVASGQSAVFDTTGSATVAVTSGSVAPNAWTFTPGAQPYSISGGAVNFSLPGNSGGVIDSANAGQTITIFNNIGESAPGVQVQLNGASTLFLRGGNTYTGGTTVSSGGTLRVANSLSVGTGTVTLSNGVFQGAAISPEANITFANHFLINNTPSGSTIDSAGADLVIAGNITDGNGPGKLTVTDSVGASHGGFTRLLGTNTYTGGTLICSCAQVFLGDSTHTASILGDVINQGTFGIINANTSGITSITNDGSLGHGTTVFSNATSASSIAINNINSGTTSSTAPRRRPIPR